MDAALSAFDFWYATRPRCTGPAWEGATGGFLVVVVLGVSFLRPTPSV
jgi:uncharacterized membrane protein